MKRFFLFPITAILTFLFGVITVWTLFSVNTIVDFKGKNTTPPTAFNEIKPRLNGELEVNYVGSYKNDNVTIDKFIVTNNSSDSVTYKDYGVMGLENQTMSWFRKRKNDKARYIGKAFCGVGLEKVNFEKSLLPNESKLFEVELYNEKASRYEIGFSVKIKNESEEKIMWASVNKTIGKKK